MTQDEAVTAESTANTGSEDSAGDLMREENDDSNRGGSRIRVLKKAEKKRCRGRVEKRFVIQGEVVHVHTEDSNTFFATIKLRGDEGTRTFPVQIPEETYNSILERYETTTEDVDSDGDDEEGSSLDHPTVYLTGVVLTNGLEFIDGLHHLRAEATDHIVSSAETTFEFSVTSKDVSGREIHRSHHVTNGLRDVGNGESWSETRNHVRELIDEKRIDRVVMYTGTVLTFIWLGAMLGLISFFGFLPVVARIVLIGVFGVTLLLGAYTQFEKQQYGKWKQRNKSLIDTSLPSVAESIIATDPPGETRSGGDHLSVTLRASEKPGVLELTGEIDGESVTWVFTKRTSGALPGVAEELLEKYPLIDDETPVTVKHVEASDAVYSDDVLVSECGEYKIVL